MSDLLRFSDSSRTLRQVRDVPNRGSLTSTHIFGTHVPVEEPSTASIGDIARARACTQAQASWPLFKLEQDRETPARAYETTPGAVNVRRCRHRVGRSSQAPDRPDDTSLHRRC